jgi:uncharacterized protein with beta-barrel porin domain
MKLLLRSIVFLSVATFTPLAFAQTYWVGGTNGDYNTATNWSTTLPVSFTTVGTGPVPTYPDVAVIYPNLVSTSTTSANGAITITQNASDTLGGLLINNNLGFLVFTTGQGGTVTLSSSATSVLSVEGSASVGGHGDTAAGDIQIDGGTTLTLAGTGTMTFTNGRLVVGDPFNPTFFGVGDSGTLNINSGTFSTVPVGVGSKTEVNIGSGAGAVGTMTQGTATTSATVITGNWFYIGVGGGNGSYTLTGGSLNTGMAGSVIALGVNSQTNADNALSGTNSVGTLSITGNAASTVNIGNAGTADLQVGTLALTPTATFGGTGTITQNDANSQVNIIGASTMEIGDGALASAPGSTGTYNLMAGSLNILGAGTVAIGFGANSQGTLNQTGGSITTTNAFYSFTIGESGGTGTYAFSGGTADFKNGFMVGSTGTLTQSGTSVLTSENSVTIYGVYNMNGGTATFSSTPLFGNALIVNGTLNLNGGILNVGANPVTGLTGTGALNFGGGTLNFTSGTTFTDNFSGGTLANGTVSTIDAGTGAFTSVTINQNLSDLVPLSPPGGGIILIGTDGNNGTAQTMFSFGGTNTYTGPTTIEGGTLTVSGTNIEHSSALNITSYTNPVAFGGVSVGTLDLNLAAGGLAYAGAIGGNGNLNINFTNPGDTFAVQNTSNFTGAIDLSHGANPGTLQVYSGTFGTISGAGSGVTIGGPLPVGINTPVPFTVPGSGTVTFANPTYTGLTTVNAGFTLNTTNLDGDVTNAGTLNVTGAAGIAGSVTSNSGILNTTIVTGNVTNSGTFTASVTPGTVGGNFTNTSTGIIASSAPLLTYNTPTFNIGGNLILSQGGTGGTLVVRTNGTVADQYAVTGSANLNGGLIQVQVLNGGKIGMTTYTIVTGSSVTDVGTTVSSPTALFTFALSPAPPLSGGTFENLIVTQSPIAAYAQTPNQAAVAHALDGTNSPLFTLFSQIPLASASTFFPAALDQLSPESLQYARIICFENSTFLVERTDGWCTALQGGYGGLDSNAINIVAPGFDSGLGRSLGSLLASNSPAFHQAAPNGVNYYPGGGGDGTSSSSPSSESAPASTPTWDSSTQVISDSPNPYMATQNPSGPETPRLSEFISGDAVLADLNQNQTAANAPSSKASYIAGDVTGGISFRMTTHLAAGVLFDYNHTDAKTDSSGSKTKVDSYSPGLFATYFDHGFYVNGLFSFGYNNYSNTRNISFLNDTATSHPNGQQYVGNLDFGYDFHPDKHWVVGPTLGGTYTHLDIDSFTETGAPGADLAVQSQSADSLRSRLGGHVVFQTNTGDVLLQPNLTAMWQHEYMNDSSGITSSFNDFSSSPFTIQTAAPSRDSALIAVGLTATLNNSMALYLSYIADVGASDYWAQSVVGGIKARF